ncbi:hypothetical protein [Cyclonatronum proteinivorum]|nr:hypothetical protein [Cyclonatronum proteinivorum]
MVQYQLGAGCVSDLFHNKYAVTLPCLCEAEAQQASEANPASVVSMLSALIATVDGAAEHTTLPHEKPQMPDLLNLDNHAVFIPLVFIPVVIRAESERLLTTILQCDCIQVPYSPPLAPPQFLA